MDSVQQEVEKLYKSHFGRLVASVLRFSGQIDLETAEDLVQDAFSSALSTFRKDGLPDNPAAWVFSVCKNKALNRLKKANRLNRLHQGNAEEPAVTGGVDLSESALADPTLRLLFACAHPDLSPKIQVIVTLKYVVNLKVEAISKIFGMTVDGVDKLLIRARQKIRSEKILLKTPEPPDLEPRLSIVHKIIYLMFNEGYRSSWGKEYIREELCGEALILNRMLLESSFGNSETAALQALMLFNAARFKARFGPEGELLDLEEQNRDLWRADLIKLGTDMLKKSRNGAVSSYQLEASIAYLHCTAKNFGTTDWKTITRLYDKLLENNPNPFVTLNHAIALFYSGRTGEAFKILNRLQQNAFMNQYYLLNATLGKMHLLLGNYPEALTFYEKTLQQTNFGIEKDWIRKRIDEVRKKGIAG